MQIPTPGTYELCRCGQSQNQPFCDGTHQSSKFDGRETAPHDRYDDVAQVLAGPKLILKDDPPRCAGLGFCHRGEGTWTETENSSNPKSKKIAVESACCCASGRLTVHDPKTNKPIEPEFKPSIGISDLGPLYIKGGVKIISSDGTAYETRNRVTLCRCGKSGNKPFCDASHSDE